MLLNVEDVRRIIGQDLAEIKQLVLKGKDEEALEEAEVYVECLELFINSRVEIEKLTATAQASIDAELEAEIRAELEEKNRIQAEEQAKIDAANKIAAEQKAKLRAEVLAEIKAEEREKELAESKAKPTVTTQVIPPVKNSGSTRKEARRIELEQRIIAENADPNGLKKPEAKTSLNESKKPEKKGLFETLLR